MISPEGTFPVIGRSSAYRFGAMQHLSTMALLKQLPHQKPNPRLCAALTAVIRRTMEAAGTFDEHGWLQVGAVGHQPSIREGYIATGSLYLCLTGLLHLGLPADDPFWTAPPRTGRKNASGPERYSADHAKRRRQEMKAFLPVLSHWWSGLLFAVSARAQVEPVHQRRARWTPRRCSASTMK